jgi:hypothetical protein
MSAVNVLLRAVAASLTMTMTVAVPSSAFAAPEADPVVEAQQLFIKGQSNYETLDYEAAIENWVAAYAKFPHAPEFAAQRSTVLYAIAQARLDLFDAEKDTAHLKHARRLLARYHSELAEDDAEGRAAVQEWIDKVDARLVEAEAEAVAVAEPEPEPEPEGPEPQPATPIEAPAVEEGPPAGRGLTIGGGVLLGLGAGLALGGGMGFGLIASKKSDGVDAVFDDGNPDGLTVDETQTLVDAGNRAEIGQIATIAAGGALAITGAVLLGVGLTKRRSSRVALSPIYGPGIAGFGAQGRF